MLFWMAGAYASVRQSEFSPATPRLEIAPLSILKSLVPIKRTTTNHSCVDFTTLLAPIPNGGRQRPRVYHMRRMHNRG